MSFWGTRVETPPAVQHEAELRCVLLEQQIQQGNLRCAELEKQLAEYKAERQKLLDRILVLSGQKPLYEPLPEPVPAAAAPEVIPPDTSKMPAPEPRLTLRTVHTATQAAIKDGTFDLRRGRGY